MINSYYGEAHQLAFTNKWLRDFREAFGLRDKNTPTPQEVAKRDKIISAARSLISWANSQYYQEMQRAQIRRDKNLVDILLREWCPERVLSTHAHFMQMCDLLNDMVIWNMLTREERRFFTGARDMVI